MSKSFRLVRNLPVWKFYYKGNHSKPIRTTVAVVEVTPTVVTGYVLRRGNEVCARLQDAKIHSFRKADIAKLGQVSRSKATKSSNMANKTTLTKHPIFDLIVSGVWLFCCFIKTHPMKVGWVFLFKFTI